MSKPMVPQTVDVQPLRTALSLLLPLGAVMALLLLVVGIVVGGARWVVLSEDGARWALSKVPGLQASGWRGSLLGPDWSADRLQLQTLDGKFKFDLEGVRVQGLQLDWHWTAAPWLTVRAERLQVHRVTVDTGTPGPRPIPLPASVALPFQLDVQQLQVATLTIDTLSPVQSLQAQDLHLDARADGRHRVQALQAQWQGLQLTASGEVGTRAPLPVAMQASARPLADGDAPRWAAVATLQGDLPRLTLKGTLRGPAQVATGADRTSAPTTPAPANQRVDSHDPGAPALDLHATLQVLQAWPLAELQAQTQALNLASLQPGAPQTRISGRVDLASRAKDAPMSATLALANDLPGRWDQGRLPVAQFSGVITGSLADRSKLEFQRLELLLADGNTGRGSAGRITGSAQWRGQQLQLQTQLQGLQPHRLDIRAAAMQLSGPFNATISGLPSPDRDGAATATRASPQLTWQTELEGQLDAAPRPVRLQLAGNASAQRLELTRAQASTGGASADLRLLLQRQPAAAAAAGSAGAGRTAPGGDWQLDTSGSLSDFDPLPWWPGEAGSVWRRGPHRLSGQWRLDLRLPGQAAQLKPLEVLQRMAGNGSVKISNSVLAGVDLAADIELTYQPGAVAAAPAGTARTPPAGALPAPSLPPAAVRAEVRAGGNTLLLEGRGDPLGNGLSDRLRVELQAERLTALAPWARLMPELAAWVPQQGTASASFGAAGRWPALSTEGQARLSQLRVGGFDLASGTAAWQLDMGGGQPLSLQLDLAGLEFHEAAPAAAPAASGPVNPDVRAPATTAATPATTSAPTSTSSKIRTWRADRVRADLRGTLAEHQMELSANLPMGLPTLVSQVLDLPKASGTRAQLQAQGAWQPATAPGGQSTAGGTWRGAIQRLLVGAADGRNNSGGSGGVAVPPTNPGVATPWIEARDLRAALQFDAQGKLQTVQAEPGTVAMLGDTALRWQTIKLDLRPDPAHLTLRADLDAIQVAPLLARWQPQVGWRGDLKVGAHLEIDAGTRFAAEMVFERTSGDVQIDNDGTAFPLGLTDLRLGLSASDGQWQFTPFVRGRNLGEIAGSVRAATTPERRWPHDQATIEGVVQARVADIGIWSTWVPPGWRLSGRLLTSATVSGRFGSPQVTGELSANQVAVRNLLQGVNVSDGEVAVRLQGETAQIERFTLRGGEGQITITGNATLGATPRAQLEVTAERFRVLGRVDRLVIATGKANLSLAQDQSRLEGRFTIDEGSFDLRASDAPTLDDDVNVRRPGAPAPSTTADAVPRARRNFVMGVDIDLGNNLRVRGRGLDTALRGQLRLTAPGGLLAMDGTIFTDGGTYAAYGQKLDIERGFLHYNGPVNNPRLDVLALRPNIDTRVGVAIAGSLLAPRVRLYADPDISDTDKLSWLVLGRAPDGLGRADTALLQRAAVALLAGEGEAPTDAFMKTLGIDELSLRQGDGETRETVISLGKQLSRRWYVGYERGVNATTGTWQLIYRIAQRFTLRAQSGLENSLDVIWVWRTQETPASAAQNKTTVTPP